METKKNESWEEDEDEGNVGEWNRKEGRRMGWGWGRVEAGHFDTGTLLWDHLLRLE